MHRAVVLALDGVVPFELSLAARILGAAEGLYEVTTCSLDGAPVATGADYSVVVAHDASVLAEADTVVIPGSEAHAAFTGPHTLPEPLAAALAGRARMSPRTFTRRFRAETGTSPGRWLLQQRLDLARTLLEAGDLPVDQVATRSGFGTAASLRRHFAAGVGVSPVAYRRAFRREATAR